MIQKSESVEPHSVDLSYRGNALGESVEVSHSPSLRITEAELGRRPQCQPLVIATQVSALGGFLFGYDNIVISGAIHYLSLFFGLNAAGTGWAAGCALIGCLAGSCAAGAIVDRGGQKLGLALCALCFAISSVGVWFSGSLAQFVIWRIIGGIGIGGASIVAPMYIAEIAPARLRGRLVTLYQLGIVLGIFSAVFVNTLIQRMGDEVWNTTTGWRWMFAAGFVPAVAFAIVIACSVESPRWLMKVGRNAEAVRILSLLNGTRGGEAEAARIAEGLAHEQGHFAELFTSGYRRPLLIGIMLAGLSQASGITPLFSFLPEIFKAAGTATADAFMQSVFVSTVNIAFTLVALWLVDLSGRKKLLIAGTAVQCLSFAVVGWTYHTHASGLIVLICVMSFVAAHAIGNGVVCWVIISEIFPTKLRGRAMSIATTALWAFAYVGNQCFPLMLKRLGTDGTFWWFSFAALLNLIFVSLFVVETKGRSLEEISQGWLQTSHERGTVS